MLSSPGNCFIDKTSDKCWYVTKLPLYCNLIYWILNDILKAFTMFSALTCLGSWQPDRCFFSVGTKPWAPYSSKGLMVPNEGSGQVVYPQWGENGAEKMQGRSVTFGKFRSVVQLNVLYSYSKVLCSTDKNRKGQRFRYIVCYTYTQLYNIIDALILTFSTDSDYLNWYLPIPIVSMVVILTYIN